MANDCLFCAIIAGDEEGDIVARTDDLVAFRDKFPRAPVHVLIASTRHIDSVHELDDDDGPLLTAVFSMARRIAGDENITDGYRVATNVGRAGGQAIPHLHFHLIGGRQLGHIDDAG